MGIQMTERLLIKTLGNFTVQWGDEVLTSFPSRKVGALLIYLAVESANIHRRESLFTLFWPELSEPAARHNLRQVLYALRQSLPEIPLKHPPLLITDRHTIQINPEADISLDLHQMENLLGSIKDHPHTDLTACQFCIQTMEQAVDL